MHAKAILDRKGSNVVTVTPEARVDDVARLFKQNRIGFALVRAPSGGRFVGTVSERDIIQGLALSGAAIAAQPISRVLTANVVTCTPETSVETMMELMTDKRTRHLVVMDRDTVMGVVSIGDVIKSQISHYQHEAQSMREYVNGVGYN